MSCDSHIFSERSRSASSTFVSYSQPFTSNSMLFTLAAAASRSETTWRSSSVASSCPLRTIVPASATILLTMPSRCASISTWFSTTSGPVATNTSSEGAAAAAPGAAFGAEYSAFAGVGVELLHPARASAPESSTPMNFGSHFKAFTESLLPRTCALLTSDLPPEPSPQFCPRPHPDAAEQHVSRGTQSHVQLCASLHSRPYRALRVRHGNARVEHALLAFRRARRAHHRDLAFERAGRQAFELHRAALAGSQQVDLIFRDRNVHRRSG